MRRIGLAAIALVSLAVTSYALLHPAIPQDIAYHRFVDQRTILGIANFWNVISNLPFLVVGLLGLRSLLGARPYPHHPSLHTAHILLFAGVGLVALGSAYYHLRPDNDSLIWDRLPMTIAFMALFSIVIAELVSMKAGKLLLWPLIGLGLLSVVYWHATESAGAGDLRPYLLIQFLPVLLIPLMLVFFKSGFTQQWGYWLLLLAYVCAKLLEHFDASIYALPPQLSGHSLKHIVAACGIFILLMTFRTRARHREDP